MDRFFTVEEFGEAFKEFSAGKSSGYDGVT